LPLTFGCLGGNIELLAADILNNNPGHTLGLQENMTLWNLVFELGGIQCLLSM
jgi:hypothetical protein